MAERWLACDFDAVENDVTSEEFMKSAFRLASPASWFPVEEFANHETDPNELVLSLLVQFCYHCITWP